MCISPTDENSIYHKRHTQHDKYIYIDVAMLNGRVLWYMYLKKWSCSKVGAAMGIIIEYEIINFWIYMNKLVFLSYKEDSYIYINIFFKTYFETKCHPSCEYFKGTCG